MKIITKYKRYILKKKGTGDKKIIFGHASLGRKGKTDTEKGKGENEKSIARRKHKEESRPTAITRYIFLLFLSFNTH